MANIDVTTFLEQCGIRKARFGGYEPDDVRTAIEAFGGEYEERMTRLEAQNRRLEEANASLEKHCQAVVAQNRVLTDQNVTLAGGNDKFSRQARENGVQLSLLKEKNRSLADQNAVLTLKNGDLEKANRQLSERTTAAEQELAEKGGVLDKEKTDLDARRADILAEAQRQADELLADANIRVRTQEEAARTDAEAMAQAARVQAQRQAQEIVDGATNEANEIRNINRLRLASLKNEVADLEKRRDALIAYLTNLGHELLHVEEIAHSTDPDGEAPQLPGQMELEPQESPRVKLDLSPEALRAVALGTVPASTPATVPAADATQPLPVPEPEPAPAPEPPPEVKPGEVPGGPVGAIFSSPIVNPRPEPIPRDEAPSYGPRTPVMPELPDTDEDEAELSGVADADSATRRAPAFRAAGSAKRRKAVRAVRALRNLRDAHN